MSFTSINGITVHYRMQRAAHTAPTVVFANSLGTDFRIWDDVIAGLEPISTLQYDKRGHGLTDTGQGTTIQHHIDDLIGLMDHLDLSNAVICGLSMGGIIAQGVAHQRPDLCRGLILCDTAHKIGTPEMWDTRATAVLQDGVEPLADAILERWFSPTYHAEQPVALAGYRNMLCRTPAQGYAGACAAIRDTDFTAATARLTLPTLCVVGTADQATPPDLVAQLAALIPGAELETIADVGHLPCIETPGKMTALITEFLTKTKVTPK